MNISYEKISSSFNKYTKLDINKRNILILGKAETDKERRTIINPINKKNALELYGDSELYSAYVDASKISTDNNIYLCNCYTTSDYLEVADKVIQYDFDYIVPISIYISDTFYNPYTRKDEYYANYILNSLLQANSLSLLIMTERHGSLYDDIDSYLKDMRIKQNRLLNNVDMQHKLNKFGTHFVFTLNILDNVKFSNAVFAALLSSSDNYSYSYPKNLSLTPIYDLDKNDVIRLNAVYFKYNYLSKSTSVEKLLNFNIDDNIYKNILINEIIRKVLKILDLSEYKGKLYNNYIKLQISTKINNLLAPYINRLYKSHTIENIGFIKTSPGCGYMYVELSIVPFGLVDKINLVMEV